MTGAGAIFALGLRDERRSILVWGGALGAFGGFMASIYPSVHSVLADVIKRYPSGLRQAFGIQDLNTVEAYVHAELFSLIVPLAIGYLAVRVVANGVVGAEQRGELDTVLTLPITRRALLAGWFAVAGAITAAALLIVGIVTFVAGRIAGTGISPGLTLAGIVGVWPLALFAAGVCAVACGRLHGSRTATGSAMGLLVAMYALDLAGRLSPDLSGLRWASAFRYYGAPLRDGIHPGGFAALALAAVLLALLATILFDRRDILR